MSLETYVIFETWIGGQLARVEIPADPAALTSRTEREKAEVAARVSFRLLSPKFEAGQRIQAVDIVTLKPIDQ